MTPTDATEQTTRYPCPVCLWKTLREPYYPSNHDICECCGTHFGANDDIPPYDDASVVRAHELLREKWLANGGKYWFVEASKRHPSVRDKDRSPIPEFIEGRLGSYD